MAEEFSRAGVPVFMADVKGDLAGLSMSGRSDTKLHDVFQTRAKTIGLTHHTYHATPTVFWDIFGVSGHAVRTTVSETGPVLLSRLLGLTDAQEGVINIAFRLTDEEGLALLDLKDLQSMLVWMGENREAIALRYGNISVASIGAIQRGLLVLENQGATSMFGEPALDLADLMKCNDAGQDM
jgi:DNA helicase HerA-like ATPase